MAEGTVEQAPVAAVDVLNAYRTVLGRDPESEVVIQENLRKSIEDSVTAFLHSDEFRTLLENLVADDLPPHVNLTAEAVQDARNWAEARLALPDLQSGPQGTGCSPVAALLFGVLRLELAAPVLARLSGARQERLEQMIEAPEQTPLSLLTMPPEPEDASSLGLLLYGDSAAPDGALPPRLLDLLRAEVHSPRFREQLVAPLLAGEPPAAQALDAASLARCRAWLRDRLGLTSTAQWEKADALLAGFLGLPFLREALAQAGPEVQEGLPGALASLQAGEILLQNMEATAEDVTFAWQLVLGRQPDDEAVMQPHVGRPLLNLLSILLRSDEFRHQVLHALVAERDPPQQRLSLAQRKALDAWLTNRLGRPSAAGTPPTAAALCSRLLSWPALGTVLQQSYGLLGTDALAALPEWHQRSAHGLTGGIDYVTGEVIAGWALDQNAPDAPLEVEIRCNDVPVGLGNASRPRLQVSGDQTSRCGFRILWAASERMRPAGGYVFRIHHARTGEPIGAAFPLDSVFVDGRDTLRFLAGELGRTQQMLRRIEAMLPQVESFAAFPATDWEGFRQRHRIAPPPASPASHMTFGVVLDAENASPAALRRLLASLAQQGHRHFRAFCLADSAAQCAVVRQAAGRDARFDLAPLGKGRSLPQATAALLREASPPDALKADCLLLLPAGVVLDTQALAWLAHAAVRHPACTGFYADSETLQPDGLWTDRHPGVELRSAYDRHLMAQHNACGDILCARRPALEHALRDLPDTGAAAQIWLAWARLAAQGPLAHLPRVLSAAIQGEGLPVTAEAPPPGLAELLAPPRTALPEMARITVVIPTRNGGATLRDCLASLAQHAARRERLEIVVVDNGSDAPETLALLDEAERAGELRRLRVDKPFNWSQLNNRAAAASSGEVLLFLNDDTRMLTQGWDNILRQLLRDPAVGAVGARLVYEDFTLQHAGVVFGVEGLVGHEGVGEPMDAPGPGGRWNRQRLAGAVTGAFLACRRADFGRAGPFDEQRFGVTFNDVDFCLRLRALGLEIVYAPQLTLVHFESKSRGIDHFDRQKQERAEFEARGLKERWGAALLVDPSWNPYWSRWSKPFAAIREPSAAELQAYLAAVARNARWEPFTDDQAAPLRAAEA